MEAWLLFEKYRQIIHLVAVAMTLAIIIIVLRFFRNRKETDATHRNRAIKVILWAGIIALVGCVIVNRYYGLSYICFFLALFISLPHMHLFSSLYEKRLPGRVSEIIIFGVILSFALAVRCYKLELYPGSINDTIAMTGNAAIRYLQDGVFLPHPWRITPGTIADARLSPVFLSSIIGLFWLWKPCVIALQVVDIIWSVLGLFFFYLLVRRQFGVTVALFAAWFLSSSAWVLSFARTGMMMSATFCMSTFTLVLLDWALFSRRIVAHVLLGITLSFCSYFYASIRVLPVFSLMLVSGALLLERGHRIKRLLCLLITLASLLIGLTPQFQNPSRFTEQYFFQRENSPPDVAFWKRTSDGNEISDRREFQAISVNFLRNLAQAGLLLKREAGFFPLVFSSFWIALALTVRNWKKASYWFHLLLLIALLLPGFATMPLSRRLFLIVIPFYTLTSVFLIAFHRTVINLVTQPKLRHSFILLEVLLVMLALPYGFVAGVSPQAMKHHRLHPKGNEWEKSLVYALRDYHQTHDIYVLDTYRKFAIIEFLLVSDRWALQDSQQLYLRQFAQWNAMINQIKRQRNPTVLAWLKIRENALLGDQCLQELSHTRMKASEIIETDKYVITIIDF